ncbi:MAG: sigma-70 family RNA polymerase sigma factor [Saprospiraceae bacterium]|nr:sigma-70 family RNA polymerase sigma factor [Saprospiraceae bacterium]MBP7679854.1 sigma-70 family RNA polymerase sigma factor [Saprospiraceae bacterium]
MMPDDNAILDLLQHTDTYERGFRLLLQKYQERLYAHIRRMVVEHEDANDVLQNTFIKVHRNINRFERKSALFTWLYRIATNETWTFLEQKNKKETTVLDDTPLGQQLYADNYIDGDALQRKLHEAVVALPEKQRTVFTMRYFDEMPYDEIAEVSGTSVGALKASFYHAVQKVEKYLKET